MSYLNQLEKEKELREKTFADELKMKECILTIQLLNNKHMVKTTLLFLSSIISIDPLKEILIQYHPILQKQIQ